MARIFLAVRDLYKKEGGALPDQVLNVDWGYTNPVSPDLGEVLKEINGKALADIPDPKDKTKTLRTAGQQLDGVRAAPGRRLDDVRELAPSRASTPRPATTPSGAAPPTRRASACIHNWAFSWPANRRIMYNRASADAQGKAWDPKRPGIVWNGEKWVGDVPDIKPDSPPGEFGAFIMLAGGRRPALHLRAERRPVSRALRADRGARSKTSCIRRSRRARSRRSSRPTRTSTARARTSRSCARRTA